MKTIKELLQELPDGIRENALDQAVPDVLLLVRRENLPQAIHSFCPWSETIEGVYFWMLVSYFDYEEAIKMLRSERPEVYEKYYKQHIEK